MITKQTLFNELQAIGVEYDPDATGHDNSDAHAPDPNEATQYDLPAVTLPVHVLTPEQLRTVPMPDLRSPEARQLDAVQHDLRTCDQRMDAELAVLREAIERIADAVTVLMLEREMRGMER